MCWHKPQRSTRGPLAHCPHARAGLCCALPWKLRHSWDKRWDFHLPNHSTNQLANQPRSLTAHNTTHYQPPPVGPAIPVGSVERALLNISTHHIHTHTSPPLLPPPLLQGRWSVRCWRSCSSRAGRRARRHSATSTRWRHRGGTRGTSGFEGVAELRGGTGEAVPAGRLILRKWPMLRGGQMSPGVHIWACG